MINPFEKRATEYLRDDAAFLSVVAPEPLHTFFESFSKNGVLFDRLCMVIGTPGSGKTTIATLLQEKIIETLINSPNIDEYKEIINALNRCGIIEGGKKIKVVGCRLPLESEYREFWELPYTDELKLGLFKSFVQARAILSWFKNFQANSRHKLEDIQVRYKDGSEAASLNVGGEAAVDVFEKARSVEKLIYEISASLVPPPEDGLKAEAIAPYHPFDAIESFVINDGDPLKPLIILDDAHTLHPSQLMATKEWLSKREMKIGRWLMMRLDAETPDKILTEGIEEKSNNGALQTVKDSRELTYIWLQSGSDRRKQRTNFKKMAKSMADKYLRLISIFSRQGIGSFSQILNTSNNGVSERSLKDLRARVDKTQLNNNISSRRREILEQEVEKYFDGATHLDASEDLKLAMLNILMHRYLNRVPQASLFGDAGEFDDQNPKKEIKVNSGVADGARVHLMHKYNRAYYFGLETLCDGSSENAEMFLELAGRLVAAAEARIIKSPNNNAELSAIYQHKLLREKSRDIIDAWSFPMFSEVKRLSEFIAKNCLEKSLEPNAALGGGATAFGVLQKDFDEIPKKHPHLAKVLKFGYAYNAFAIKPKHSTKNQEWCLIELTGPSLIANGLTLIRGGFLEKKVSDLLKGIGAEDAE